MGLFSSGSAKRAAAVQAQAYQDASDMLGETKEEALGYYDPYVQSGLTSLDEYMRLAGGLEAPTAEMYELATQMDPILEAILNPDMNAFMDTPGYEFRLAEGQKALERSAAATGDLLSGATGKELMRYGQDYATSEYDNYLNRLYNQLGAVDAQLGGRQDALNAQYQNINAYLPTLEAGLGAAGSSADIATNIGTQQASYRAGIGDAYASGMIANSNQLLDLGAGILNLGTTAVGLGAPFQGGTAVPTSAPISPGTTGITGQPVGGYYDPYAYGGGAQPVYSTYGTPQTYQPVFSAPVYGPPTQADALQSAIMASNTSYGPVDPTLPWL